jgi:hypothetical protein
MLVSFLPAVRLDYIIGINSFSHPRPIPVFKYPGLLTNRSIGYGGPHHQLSLSSAYEASCTATASAHAFTYNGRDQLSSTNGVNISHLDDPQSLRTTNSNDSK